MTGGQPGGSGLGWALPLLLATAMLTAACGNIIPGARTEPPRLFDLTPKSKFSRKLPVAKWQLIIETPVAAAGLNTARIALRQSPTTLDYFARAVWTDTAPEMVQSLLIESFDNTGKIVAVGRQSAGLRSDFVLKSDLREFQAEFYEAGAPKVRVRINAKLVRMPERSIIASTTAEHLAAADGKGVEAIVAAFDTALGRTLKIIVEWTLRTAGDQKLRSRGRRKS